MPRLLVARRGDSKTVGRAGPKRTGSRTPAAVAASETCEPSDENEEFHSIAGLEIAGDDFLEGDVWETSLGPAGMGLGGNSGRPGDLEIAEDDLFEGGVWEPAGMGLEGKPGDLGEIDLHIEVDDPRERGG